MLRAGSRFVDRHDAPGGRRSSFWREIASLLPPSSSIAHSLAFPSPTPTKVSEKDNTPTDRDEQSARRGRQYHL